MHLPWPFTWCSSLILQPTIMERDGTPSVYDKAYKFQSHFIEEDFEETENPEQWMDVCIVCLLYKAASLTFYLVSRSDSDHWERHWIGDMTERQSLLFSSTMSCLSTFLTRFSGFHQKERDSTSQKKKISWSSSNFRLVFCQSQRWNTLIDCRL